MPSYLKSKHDIGILRSDGSTKVGLMLAEREGRPLYRTLTERYLKNQFFSGAPDYGALDPQNEIAIILDDYRSGFGLEVYDSTDPKRYYSSIGMDMRHRGMGIAGNTPTTVTLPATTAPAITDGGFELWDDAQTLTNWTETGNGSLDRDEANEREGTYSAGFQMAGGQLGTLYQDISWLAGYAGRRFTLTIYCKTTAASSIRLAINDGLTTTYGTPHTGGAAYELLSVSMTLATGATRLRIIIDAYANGSAFMDGASTLTGSSLGVVGNFEEFNDELYANAGTILCKLNAGGTGFDAVYEFESNIVALQHFTDHLYICLDHGAVVEDCEDAWADNTDAAVTVTADSSDYKVGSSSAKFVAAAGIGVNTLWSSETISAVDMSGANGIEMWIKCSIATTSGELEIHLDDTANMGSPIETMDVPALVAGRWTKIHLDFASASSDTAIVGIGLYQTADIGIATVRIDDVRLHYDYYYMTAGETFTRSTLANAEFTHMEAVHKATPTLYGAHTPNGLRASTDPTNDGSWGTTVEIGSYTHDITELVEWSGTVYIMKDTIPYYLDSDGAAQGDLAPELKTEHSSTSGKNAIIWHNKIYIPAGSQSLLESDGTTNTFRDPANYATNLSDFVGRVQALGGDAHYFYAIIDNGTKVEVLAGRPEVIDGVTRWVWHPIAEIPATFTDCETAFVSTVFQERLWISSTVSTESLYYLPLPDTYGNITEDTNRLFKTDTYFITPWLHGNFKGEDKRWVKVTATLGHANDTNVYFELHYQKKGDSSWTDAGDLKGTATSRVHTLYLPDDSSSNSPISPMMRFKLVAKTDDTDLTPELLSLDIRAILRPPARKIIECVVRVQDGILDKQGSKLVGTDAAYMRTVLDEARDGSDVFTFYDPFGNTKFCIMLPQDPESDITESLKNENPEQNYVLRLQEVTLS